LIINKPIHYYSK